MLLASAAYSIGQVLGVLLLVLIVALAVRDQRRKHRGSEER
jgi:hypothetical protein